MTIRAVDIHQATEPLAEYADHIEDGAVVVTRSGRPVAVLVAIENSDLESIALGQDPRFVALIQRSRQRYRDEGGRSLEDVERELGISAQ